MTMKSRVRQLTTTALFIALLVTIQFSFASFGQWIIGPLVNLLLMITAMNLNWRSAALIGFISPFIAFILGIGTTLFAVVPWIALGNLVLVVVVSLLHYGLKSIDYRDLKQVVITIGVALGGIVLKVMVYWIGIVMITIPLLNLPAPAVTTLTYTFTVMQLFTGLVGITLFVPVHYLVQPISRRYFQ